MSEKTITFIDSDNTFNIIHTITKIGSTDKYLFVHGLSKDGMVQICSSSGRMIREIDRFLNSYDLSEEEKKVVMGKFYIDKIKND
jgi:hypothetical protein